MKKSTKETVTQRENVWKYEVYECPCMSIVFLDCAPVLEPWLDSKLNCTCTINYRLLKLRLTSMFYL